MSRIHVSNYSTKRQLAQKPAAQLGIDEQLSEIVLALSQFPHLFLSFVVGTLFHVLLVNLFAFLRRQKQVSAIEHNLVQLLFPRRKHRHLQCNTFPAGSVPSVILATIRQSHLKCKTPSKTQTDKRTDTQTYKQTDRHWESNMVHFSLKE